MRIVVAAEYPIIAEAVKLGCRDDSNLEVVGSASTGRNAIELFKQLNPDVGILDLSLPDLDGFQVIDIVRQQRLPPLFLAISMRCDPYIVRKVEISGFHGFIDLRTVIFTELRKIIATIGRRDASFPPAFVSVLSCHQRDPLAFDKILSNRQQMILALIGDLMTDIEIADSLNMTPCAIERQRHRIMDKLELSSRLDLVRYARREGLFGIFGPRWLRLAT